MSQRDSGYERKERDCYETPEWVTAALVPHIPTRIRNIYEPAAGSGKMVRALVDSGYMVDADDISEGIDFLRHPKNQTREAIVTNPPYVLAQEFVEIDNDFVIHHVTSKRKKLSEPDLRLAPLVLAELEYMWPGSSGHRTLLPSHGPVIIDQRRGLPFYADDFRAEWRKIATACGVPLNVQNRDARAGAISEAIALGAEPAHVRDAANHSNLEQTYDYSRANRENTATVMKLRRDKTGT